MPRETSNKQMHTIRILDAISGDTIAFNYRLPTTAERILYRKSGMQFKNNKIKDYSAETQLDFAKKIITGFEEAKPGADGKLKGGFLDDGWPYASDKNSPNYRENWFELIKETSADLLMQAAACVFGATGVESGQDDDEEKAGPLV